MVLSKIDRAQRPVGVPQRRGDEGGDVHRGVLTDVDAVYEGWDTPAQKRIARISARSLDPATFASGSMGPKIAAVRYFALATGRPAFIGALGEAAEILAGRAGTRIDP